MNFFYVIYFLLMYGRIFRKVRELVRGECFMNAPMVIVHLPLGIP